MIHVSHLTRTFSGIRAVDDLSFEVAQGEVVGFLGPNGAGKTTTLRMLAGFLPATAGDIRVAGFDVRREAMAVRRQIGYLPEQCPLYPEMRVDEYLRFRAALKGVARRRIRPRLGAVKEQCGLTDMGRRIVGQLSKGYRQRLGMADALIHEPPLLILDEPTIGLDPGQIREVRSLIRDLARHHTILLSTHILPEVEMTCRRVLILHRGRLVASDSTDRLRELAAGRGQVRVELRASTREAADALGTLPGVVKCAVEPTGDGWLVIKLDSDAESDIRPAVFAAVSRAGWPLRELHGEHNSLEDVFLSIIRRDEREDVA